MDLKELRKLALAEKRMVADVTATLCSLETVNGKTVVRDSTFTGVFRVDEKHQSSSMDVGMDVDGWGMLGVRFPHDFKIDKQDTLNLSLHMLEPYTVVKHPLPAIEMTMEEVEKMVGRPVKIVGGKDKELKVGMVVFIKDDLSIRDRNVVPDMVRHAGKRATITSVGEIHCELDVDGGKWSWRKEYLLM